MDKYMFININPIMLPNMIVYMLLCGDVNRMKFNMVIDDSDEYKIKLVNSMLYELILSLVINISPSGCIVYFGYVFNRKNRRYIVIFIFLIIIFFY